MRYIVHEDFEVKGGKAHPVKVEAGSVWIPAATGVPQYIVDEKVSSGVVELIRPGVAAGEGDEPNDKPRKKARR